VVENAGIAIVSSLNSRPMAYHICCKHNKARPFLGEVRLNEFHYFKWLMIFVAAALLLYLLRDPILGFLRPIVNYIIG
jgi:hypothetical protein